MEEALKKVQRILETKQKELLHQKRINAELKKLQSYLETPRDTGKQKDPFKGQLNTSERITIGISLWRR